MKKLLIVGACLVATVGAMAQGRTIFGNRTTGVDFKVLQEDKVTPCDANYAAEAWVGATGGALSAVAGSAVAFRSGAGAGYIPTATITVPFAQGTVIDAQMRAWKGAPAVGWAAASLRGESKTFTHTLAVDPTPTGVLMSGTEGFSIIPEPSTIALAILGGAALLLRRRK